jgi:hypothetical protein
MGEHVCSASDYINADFENAVRPPRLLRTATIYEHHLMPFLNGKKESA